MSLTLSESGSSITKARENRIINLVNTMAFYILFRSCYDIMRRFGLADRVTSDKFHENGATAVKEDLDHSSPLIL